MTAMMQFATLVITTIFAALAAVAFDWLLLRAAFRLMKPATARRVVRPDLVRPTMHLARAHSARR